MNKAARMIAMSMIKCVNTAKMAKNKDITAQAIFTAGLQCRCHQMNITHLDCWETLGDPSPFLLATTLRRLLPSSHRHTKNANSTPTTTTTKQTSSGRACAEPCCDARRLHHRCCCCCQHQHRQDRCGSEPKAPARCCACPGPESGVTKCRVSSPYGNCARGACERAPASRTLTSPRAPRGESTLWGRWSALLRNAPIGPAALGSWGSSQSALQTSKKKKKKKKTTMMMIK